MLVDADASYRRLLKIVVMGDAGFRVVAEASTLEDAPRVTALQQPDVVILDPDRHNGLGPHLELLSELRSASPQARLIVHSFLEQDHLLRTLANGCPIVPKSADFAELILAVRDAAGRGPAAQKSPSRIAYRCRHCTTEVPPRGVLLIAHAREHQVPVASCYESNYALP